MTRTAEDDIRQLIEQWLPAVRSRDVEAITAPYAENIRAFDAIQHLQFQGKAAYRAHWQACMDHCPGDMVFEIEQLQIQATPELALAHWLNRCGPNKEESCYMRATVGYQRIDGQWKVIHEHWSAPFDMESGAALFSLKP
ncbi:YybH family protein [Pseudomonas rubra]|uniref:Nuclear transport factor 2 family protein n=1 Tax=Pseudomonas rubra TaxID=2942627 RepID=A0ABT5P3M6_9PSED|nr:nuclear transport factor 2 family protein [Pseudomonas rubra]MDD1012850.1 nuclear transport factor 2 family protein [Pseudomonas rubra]MDD1036822.1 nuclear transport factor 2 family protein [Pseudomonas rubra]MDD1157041.1 nuclear transport factor 2 family protein [Pseudomonas rubra]